MMYPMKPINAFNKYTTYFRNYCGLLLAVVFVILSLNSCQSNSRNKDNSPRIKAPSLDQNTDNALKNYQVAKSNYTNNPNDPDAIIWLGRRAAYLGNYEEAINVFTKGIEHHPKDARMFRHRGHRYISTRAYNKAIEDLEIAASLIKNQQDQVEPDGLPNSKNIPLSTLHGNIWYHLGLAYYLKNDMDNALRAFSNRTVTERYDDNLVSGGHWLYMILSRQGKFKEADAAVSKVTVDMDIIENASYHKMCLFYKNMIPESELLSEDPQSASDNVFNYGLGNWYLYEKHDTLRAKTYYRQLLDKGNPYSFAYIAAEADWQRLFEHR